MTGRRTFAEQGYRVWQVLFKTCYGPFCTGNWNWLCCKTIPNLSVFQAWCPRKKKESELLVSLCHYFCLEEKSSWAQKESQTFSLDLCGCKLEEAVLDHLIGCPAATHRRKLSPFLHWCEKFFYLLKQHPAASRFIITTPTILEREPAVLKLPSKLGLV